MQMLPKIIAIFPFHDIMILWEQPLAFVSDKIYFRFTYHLVINSVQYLINGMTWRECGEWNLRHLVAKKCPVFTVN